MNVVRLSSEEKKAFRVYSVLRKYAPRANLITLRQISVYIARSGFVNDISSDIKVIYNEVKDVSVVLFSNGVEIEFDDYSGEFDFVVNRKCNNFSMNTLVSLSNPDDASTVSVYSELKVKRNGMYVVAFRPKDICGEGSLKFATINYYTDDEIDWVKEIVDEEIDDNFDIIAKRNGVFPFADECGFEILPQTDMILDCYSGYISNMLVRIDLLYDNVKCLNVKKKKKIKSN